ncbi:MAG: response regulator [Verrucomicrobiota bacterium]
MTSPHPAASAPADAPDSSKEPSTIQPDSPAAETTPAPNPEIAILEGISVKMAHSFNDILTSMMGIQSVMQSDLEKGVVRKTHLEHLDNASRKAAQLTGDLLKFGRHRPGLKPGPVNILNFVQDLRPELKKIIGETARIEIECEDEKPFAAIGRDDLRDVFARLAANVRDFAKDESTITIHIAKASDACNDEVIITVRDNGPGMKPSVLENATRPFFTTRPEGKARGLGLSVVHGIIRDYGGTLSLANAEPDGSEITLRIPAATPSPQTNTPDKPGDSTADAESSSQDKAKPPTGSGETILVVEDERMVRDLVTRSLGYLGYEVIDAENGEEGLEVARQRHEDIDLIFTDIVMPRMSGPEMVQRLQEEHEDMPVLFTTGFTDNKRLLQDGEIREGVNLLPKPYTTRVLASRIREVLDA